MIKKIIIGLFVFLLLGSSFSFAEENLNTPPYEPTNPHPEDGAIDVGMKTHLSWVGGDPDQGDKAVYDLYFGTNSNPGLSEKNLQMPNYDPGDLERNTQYYWKVVARDESQAETSGPIWTFTTNDCDCNPPEQPSGPTRARNRNQYEYTTKLMIQNQNGLYYNFSWGDGNCSGWLGPFNHNERVQAEYEWQDPGEYQVQAQARFRNNVSTLSLIEWTTTGWSEPLSVTATSEDLENDPPETPTITGTTNGKAGEEYEYTFSAADPNDDDIYIYIEFCSDCEENQWYGPFSSGYQLTLSHAWKSQGEYSVKAKVKDVYDAESEWSTLDVSMPQNKEVRPFPNDGFMQRMRNRICDALGLCPGESELINLTGRLTYDGTNFLLDGIELHFGPTWYITSAESAIDYDGDGTLEIIYDELQGLVGAEITIEGHEQSDQWVSVFTINGEVYREPGQPIWSSQHQWQWRHGHGPNKP